ncbi:MAG: hypothetical protein ACI9WS_000695 [Paraglaciecola psychrophila]|jgi:hypothetical protein
MSVIRNRAINNFPMVLLTLLSIVQALAFELLWAEVQGRPELYQWTVTAVIGWAQVVTMLLGIILVWLSYATSVMRFRWMPSTLDSLFPFLVGILQFIMVDNLGIDTMALWLFLLVLLFAGMNWINHHDMTRARLNPENDEFFLSFSPAGLSDYYATMIALGALSLSSVVIVFSDTSTVLYGCAALVALMVVVKQVFVLDSFWQMSMSLDSEDSENNGDTRENIKEQS